MTTEYMKLARQQVLDETGSCLVHGEKVSDTVESWNWNLNIFEIYDEIRDHNDRSKKHYSHMLTTFLMKIKW